MGQTAEASASRLAGFFACLSDDLTDVAGSEHKTLAAGRLRDRMRKRARISSNGLSRKAIDKFVFVNESLSGFKHSLNEEVLNNARLFITRTLERYVTHLDESAIQETFCMDAILNNWRFGPGASFEVEGSHTARKLNCAMTATKLSLGLVKTLRNSHYSFQSFDARTDGIAVVRGSKLTSVPKNEDTHRTIAIEPSGNMALQLAVGQFFSDALRLIGLDIETQQDKNKNLALLASLNNHLSTIDLSMASDMITPSLVRALFPADVFEFLWRVRSPELFIDGRWVQANMMSTMGNGFTFPLMTLILASLLYANSVTYHDGLNNRLDWSTHAVYGDDLIVPVNETASLLQVLESAGFVVNTDKSYSDGPFRESCGGDFHFGMDITPFYVKSISTIPEVYTALNQLIDWSAKTSCFCFQSFNFLIQLLPGEPFFVPEWLSDYSGIRSVDVQRKYHSYRLRQNMTHYRGNPAFEFMLVAGGYCLPGHKGSLMMLERESQQTYEVVKSRLPRGYLDGADSFLGNRSYSLTRQWVIDVYRL